MKATKKIVGAACALVAAVALSAGSTFAWFSTNSVVKADGMTVGAQASGNLVISKDDGLDKKYSSSVTLDALKQNIAPVSTDGTGANLTTAPVFYKMSNPGTGMTEGSSASGIDATFEATESDYLFDTVWVKSIGQEISGLTVNAEITSSSEKLLDNSLRLMVVSNDGFYIFTLKEGASGEYKAVIDASGGLSASNVTLSTKDSTNILASGLTAEQEYELDIYIWFEGQDASCTTVNALNVEDTTISISFEAVV